MSSEGPDQAGRAERGNEIIVGSDGRTRCSFMVPTLTRQVGHPLSNPPLGWQAPQSRCSRPPLVILPSPDGQVCAHCRK
jgi:hypothetical protein